MRLGPSGGKVAHAPSNKTGTNRIAAFMISPTLLRRLRSDLLPTGRAFLHIGVIVLRLVAVIPIRVIRSLWRCALLGRLLDIDRRRHRGWRRRNNYRRIIGVGRHCIVWAWIVRPPARTIKTGAKIKTDIGAAMAMPAPPWVGLDTDTCKQAACQCQKYHRALRDCHHTPRFIPCLEINHKTGKAESKFVGSM